jgi:hypothetical protein
MRNAIRATLLLGLPIGFSLVSGLSLTPAEESSDTLKLDQSAAEAREWGYRPSEGSTPPVNPPAFCWHPQKNIERWQVRVYRGTGDRIAYQADGVDMSVHTPPHPFEGGSYRWQYRGMADSGKWTEWSKERSFRVDPSVSEPMPMPTKEELLDRIPQEHPRLFVRPGDLPRLREMAGGPMKEEFDDLIARCEKLMENPPDTTEPPKYQSERLSEQWRKTWWGNRTYTIRALEGAATLAFTRLLGGKEEYGRLAKKILLECAKWDPKGATGYRYNDEAGMPYAYHFSRTYTFVNDLLTEEEKEKCREVMRIRGEEMYHHLYPRHLWRPYSSHSNRAWHFLGEVGIAFHGEIPEADRWSWFAMNVFYAVYPVWSDRHGGWHEGVSYWSSYIGRFTWWADVMRAAFGIDAYRKPYFSQIGYYPMYLMPPGKVGGGFGDLTARRTARSNLPLMSILAAQSGNRYWQWYVETLGGPVRGKGYIGFLRGALPEVKQKVPSDLPASRLFEGTGQAYLNSNLLDADDDVQVVFKSSPFGTQSHGYEANNSFLLWGWGERLLIRTGYRDIYGSAHHKNWMWSTRSVNNITLDGFGQAKHSAGAKGEITHFFTSPEFDIVVGEAAGTYRAEASEKWGTGPMLDRYTRAIVFVKPDLVVVYDRLEAKKPATYRYWLHALQPFQPGDNVKGDGELPITTEVPEIERQRDIALRVGQVRLEIDFLLPEGLTFSQTNQYDPNPRERISLREWHLAAKTPVPEKATEFLALYRIAKDGKPSSLDATVFLEKYENDGVAGYELQTAGAGGKVTLRLPKTGDQVVPECVISETDR